ncbi:MAG TPA: helix-turn-helix domain-containing protein [Nitrospira sp.]|nr:helix-turn-helix domain-containing protein [Nitrospira sp.]
MESVDAAILRAARAQLALRGYAQMSVNDIARAAGVSKPTIYLRYPTKAQIALAALEALSRDPERVGMETSTTVRNCLSRFDEECQRINAIGLFAAVLLEREETPELIDALNRHFIGPWAAAIRRLTARHPGSDARARIVLAMGVFLTTNTVGSARQTWMRYAEQLLLSL